MAVIIRPRTPPLLSIFSAALVACAAFPSGCKDKSPAPKVAAAAKASLPEFPPPDPPRDIDIESLTDPVEKLLHLTIREKYPEQVARWEQEREDRRELMLPAPKDFTPEFQGRKLKLSFIPKSTLIRKGGSFWYRAELQNVGSETVRLTERGTETFFKDGAMQSELHDGVQLHITAPSGKKVRYIRWFEYFTIDCTHYEPPPPIPGWERMSDAEREKAAQQYSLKQWARVRVDLRLLPGETLRTRPFKWVDPADACKARSQGREVDRSVPSPFREMRTEPFFRETGTYTLQLVLREKPPAIPTKEALAQESETDPDRVIRLYKEMAADALGTVESNILRVEVVP